MLPEVITVLQQSLQMEDDCVQEAWLKLYDAIGNSLSKFKEIQFVKDKK